MMGGEEPTSFCYEETELAVAMQHKKPTKMINVKGDAACLPRAISLALYGHEGHHQKLRDLNVEFQENNAPKPLTTTFKRRMSRMRKRETFMETEEVEAFSQLLQTPIYSCNKAQTKFLPGNDAHMKRLPTKSYSHVPSIYSTLICISNLLSSLRRKR